MVLENPNATRFAPIDKLKMTKFRGDGEEIEETGDGKTPSTTTVNGQQITFYYDCGYRYDDGKRQFQWYDANWNLLAEYWT